MANLDKVTLYGWMRGLNLRGSDLYVYAAYSEAGKSGIAICAETNAASELLGMHVSTFTRTRDRLLVAGLITYGEVSGRGRVYFAAEARGAAMPEPLRPVTRPLAEPKAPSAAFWGNHTGIRTGNPAERQSGNPTEMQAGNLVGTQTKNLTGAQTKNPAGTQTENHVGTQTGKPIGSRSGTCADTRFHGTVWYETAEHEDKAREKETADTDGNFTAEAFAGAEDTCQDGESGDVADRVLSLVGGFVELLSEEASAVGRVRDGLEGILEKTHAAFLSLDEKVCALMNDMRPGCTDGNS